MTTLSDGSQLEFRFAREADAGLILTLIRELAEYEKLSHEVVATEEGLRAQLFGAVPAAEVVLAFRDDKPIGFALFFQNFSTFLGRPGIYLEDLYVRPECRALGIGKRLLTFIAQLAQERGCGRFEWSVLNWNTPAIQFYEKIGAQPMKEWTVYRLSGETLSTMADQGRVPLR